MKYTPVFNLYPGGWKNKPNSSTPLNATALNAMDQAAKNIDNYLYDNPILDNVLNRYTDVNIQNPKDGDLLIYNGSQFVNGQANSSITISDQYTDIDFSESKNSYVRGGYSIIAKNLVSINLEVLTEKNALNGKELDYLIGSNFPIPKFPSGINSIYGMCWVRGMYYPSFAAYGTIVSACRLDSNGKLYLQKRPWDYEYWSNSEDSLYVVLNYIKA